MDYRELTKRLKASIAKEYKARRESIARSDARIEAQQRAIDKKRREREDVALAGGGHALARKMMGKDTQFNYGANELPDNQQKFPDETYPCNGACKCTVCGKHIGYHAELEEDKKMLPTGNESESPRSNKRQSNQVWLKNEDLSMDVKTAKIIDVRYNKDGRFGARVEMKLALNGTTRFWGIPPKVDDKNPNYREMLAAFGADENSWVNREIGLFLEQDTWSGNYFPRVVIMEDTSEAQPGVNSVPQKQRTSRGHRS